MAQAAFSTIESALENQRIGGLQIRVAALCALVQVCDGYDINSIGVSVPSLTHAWSLPGPAFTTAFLWSSIGILVGALSAGPIGDRVGRKPLLVASLTIFGAASLFTAFAGSLLTLSILRFFTGLGIGGGFAGAASLTGDYAPHRRRALMIMASFTGAPIGGFLCGQIAGMVLPTLGWPSIFVIGGIVPLLIVVALILWLPESPRFLAAKAYPSRREAALLHRLAIHPGQGGTERLDVADGNPVKMLFGPGYALQTMLMWIIFFCSLMNLFLFIYWMPEVLHLTGMTPPEAARATSFRELGAILAVVYLGVLIDRFGPERALAWHYARRHALPDAGNRDLLLRHDDHRQPDRRQRGLRQALSGAHAHQRSRLGARYRPPRRHRRADLGRVFVEDRHGAAAYLPQRLPLRDNRRGGDGVALIAGNARRASGQPLRRLTLVGRGPNGAIWRR